MVPPPNYNLTYSLIAPPLISQYKVTVDYEPFSDDHHGISLKVDQTVEVLERLEDGRWFVQATTITGQVCTCITNICVLKACIVTSG